MTYPKYRNLLAGASRRGLAVALAFLFVFGPYALILPVEAADLTSISDTMSRQIKSVASNHTIVFTTPTGISADDSTMTITFPAGFTMGSVGEDDIDISGSTTGEMTTAADCSATDEVGIGVSGQVITFTFCNGDGGSIAASETVTVEIGTNATASGTGSNQITNPATASASSTDYTISIGGTMTDSGSFVVPILDDDQVHISATVAEELTFQLIAADDATDFFSASSNNIDFGSLSSSAIRFATEGSGSGGSGSKPTGGAHGIKAGTNGAGGYSITVAGSTLTSGGDTITAIGGTGAASSAGSEQFGICLIDDATGTPGTDATDTTQPGQIDAEYDCTANTNDNYAFLTGDEVATGNASGPTSTTFYDVHYMANISVLTESGTYTTDLTYIATGTF